MSVSIVGTYAEDKLDLFAGLIELESCQQQVAQICMGLPIARCKIYCARELRVRPGPHPQLQKALGKLKMRLRKTGINLRSVLKLDGGLAIFFFRKVPLPARVISLFARIGRARCAAEDQHHKNSQSD